MWIGTVNESNAPYSSASTALPATKASAYGNNSAILKNVLIREASAELIVENDQHVPYGI